MTDRAPVGTRVAQVLMTEQSIYGLILVSGMIVVSNSVVGTSINALATVAVTVVVFFLAHVYAGTLARLAADEAHGDFAISIRAAAHESRGLLVVALLPLVVLGFGVTRVIDDEAAIWTALAIDVIALGVLGWLAVARWNTNVWARLGSALITAAFGVIVMALKVLIHH